MILKLFIHLCFFLGAFFTSVVAMEFSSENIEEAFDQMKVDEGQSSDDQSSSIRGHLSILSIDDNKLNLSVMERMLKRLGYMNVMLANSAEEALKIIKDKAEGKMYFDVILTDINMPGMDGIDCAKEIRKIPHMESVPIVAVTTEVEAEIRERCLESGINGFMPKPFTSEILEEILIKRKLLFHLD